MARKTPADTVPAVRYVGIFDSVVIALPTGDTAPVPRGEAVTVADPDQVARLLLQTGNYEPANDAATAVLAELLELAALADTEPAADDFGDEPAPDPDTPQESTP